MLRDSPLDVLGSRSVLFARKAAFARPLLDALFVPVCLRGVDVSVPELERPADCV